MTAAEQVRGAGVLDGAGMHALAAGIADAPRSITGDGVRATLAGVGAYLPLQVHEVPSGTRVLDWVVPPEWNVREAWLAAPDGTRVADFARHRLHLMGYSTPVRRRLPLAELQGHLHSLPDRPDLIPYRTSYYAPAWGFCLPDAVRRVLPEGEYEACVDATFDAGGHLSYGELVLPGATGEEVLVSTHVCHPAMANDNLSGIVVATALAQWLCGRPRRLTYRFLFAPGTIGSITWLAAHREEVSRIRAGLVLTGLGDPGPFTYKRSRRGASWVDRVLEHVLAPGGGDPGEGDPGGGDPGEGDTTGAGVVDFSPYGYDERQFCSPGFDLPVGRLSRSPHGEYPEYHTSGDDLAFVTPGRLAGSLALLQRAVGVLEDDRRYLNTSPYGEPNLGRRGLYRQVGGAVDQRSVELGYLWMLSASDGDTSVLDVARRSGIGFDALCAASRALVGAGLLTDLGPAR